MTWDHIGLGLAIAVAVLTLFAYAWRGARKAVHIADKLDDLDKKLSTNHGMNPGEYIEKGALGVFSLQQWAIDHTKLDDARWAIIQAQLPSGGHSVTQESGAVNAAPDGDREGGASS